MNEGKVSKAMIMVLEIAAILLAAAVVMGIYNAHASNEPVTMYVMCHLKSEVNGREKPSLGSPMNCRLFPGDEVQVDYLSAGRGWCHIVHAQNESGECWVKSDYLVSSKIDIYEIGIDVLVSASGRVAVRRAPNKSAKRLYWVKPGDTVTVYAVSQDWCDIGDGYIMTKFLQYGEAVTVDD